MPPLPTAPGSLLVRGVNWLGDAVMTTPALLRLREHFPRARISLLTPAKLADLWHAHPALDSVIPFTPDESPWHIGRQLRNAGFDLAVILPNSTRAALEPWLARIPCRVGYPGNARSLFLTHRVARPPTFVRMHKRSPAEVRQCLKPLDRPLPPRLLPTAHHLHHYLHLVAALGVRRDPLPPQLTVTPAEMEATRRKFSLAPPHSWIGVNPGAEYGPAKRWPLDRFLQATRQIQKRSGHRWVLLGGPADVSLAQNLATALAADFPDAPPLNLAGRTSLRELCAVLGCCRALLTNDTGPMHVAAALGIPVVALFGSTSPELTGPGLPDDPRHRLLRAGVPCSPCFRRECPIDFRCMTSLSVDAVVGAVLSATDSQSRAPSSRRDDENQAGGTSPREADP